MPTETAKSPKGWIEISEDHCKGCYLCVEDCPHHDIEIALNFNRMGYHPAKALNVRCTGCGICFYSCPEPRAIRVFKRAAAGKGES
jgi:Pyruvate/2-oxoacid:ferredoxin oxidoreductase delta subunit